LFTDRHHLAGLADHRFDERGLPDVGNCTGLGVTRHLTRQLPEAVHLRTVHALVEVVLDARHGLTGHGCLLAFIWSWGVTSLVLEPKHELTTFGIGDSALVGRGDRRLAAGVCGEACSARGAPTCLTTIRKRGRSESAPHPFTHERTGSRRSREPTGTRSCSACSSRCSREPGARRRGPAARRGAWLTTRNAPCARTSSGSTSSSVSHSGFARVADVAALKSLPSPP